jgi:hypothetical protein
MFERQGINSDAHCYYHIIRCLYIRNLQGPMADGIAFNMSVSKYRGWPIPAVVTCMVARRKDWVASPRFPAPQGSTALSHFHMPPTLGLHRQLRKLPRTHTRPHLQSEGSRLNITITIHLVTCDNHSAKSESYQEDARHTDRTASEGEIDG